MDRLSITISSMAAAPHQITFYFLDLPPELRRIIYLDPFVEEEPIVTYRQLGCKPATQGSAASTPVSTSYTSFSLPSTYLLAYQYVVRPELPPIASVSKLIRNEVVSLYLSANKFTIRVANGYLCTSPFPWAFVDQWRQHLGDYARHLRDITVTTHNLHADPGS